MQTREILQKYMDSAISSDGNIAFFLLSGAKGLGKSAMAQDLSKAVLGNYFVNDFLYIKDFSDQLQKLHSIRVEAKDSEISSTLLKDYSYQDLGVREINTWLQRAPSGQIKILLLENIERMTLGAANAFLKTCEEPLANRVIIATTSNKSVILPTILSRSVLVPFDFKEPQIDDGLKLELTKLLELLSSGENIHKKHQALLEIKKNWPMDLILDQIVFQYSQNGDFKQAQKRIEVKKMSKNNVSIDNLLFYGLLD